MAVKRCATATREMAKKWDVHAVNQAKKNAMSQIVPVFEFHELDIPKAYPNCQTMSAVSQPWGTTHDWFPNKT